MSDRYIMVDSFSDGMCGSVVVEDRESGLTVKRHWDVFQDELYGQAQAFNAAVEDLKDLVRDDLILPSGRILHREKLPNGTRTVIPADAADEYGKYVFDRGNEAARRLSNGK